MADEMVDDVPEERRMEAFRALVEAQDRRLSVADSRAEIARQYDLSEADVARGLGCSVGAVKRHARRGLEAMRISLDAQLSEAY